MTKSLQLIVFFSLIVSILSCNNHKIKPSTTSPFYDQIDAKLWKHRVNCIGDIDSAVSLFPGIEVDISYADSTTSFICSHGESCSGETLEALLAAIDEDHLPYLWLDFKNSNDSAVVANSVSILKEKLAKFGLLKRTIVESKNLMCIDSLTKHGLYSSYWVPHYYDTSPPYSNEEMKSKIASAIKKHNPTVLSADYNMFNFLKQHFPESFLHLWLNGPATDANKNIVNELRTYPNTKVVLVDFAQPY